MTTEELNTIVEAVVAELEKNGVDFDNEVKEAQDTDLVFVIRETDSGYGGFKVTWKGLLDIITAQATQAKNDAETAKNAANTILEQVQSKGTEITNFVATSKTEIETQKNESVEEVRTVYQGDLNELKGDLEAESKARIKVEVEVARNRRQIENLNDRLDGDLIENKYKMTGEIPDDAGVLSLPSSKLLHWAEVDEVHGRTEVYSENLLQSARNAKVESVGRNMFDEKVVETGYLINGEIKTGYGTRWASESYIKVEPGTKYYIVLPYNISNYGIRISWYDSNKTHISTSDYYTNTITSPEGAEYMRFNVNSNYGSQSYKGDCVVQLASITDRTYIPHSHSIVAIPSDWYTKAEALGYDLGMEGCTIDMVGKKVTWGKRIEGLGIVDIIPFTKTFAELGFEPIDNGLPVESNGTITVISEDAQAEAMIHYAIDNRSTT